MNSQIIEIILCLVFCIWCLVILAFDANITHAQVTDVYLLGLAAHN